MAVRVWKASLVLDHFARQERKKMWPTWGLLWSLIDVWQPEWSRMSWIWITKLLWHFLRGIGHADTWMLHHDYTPYHTAIPWTTSWPKRLLQWYRIPLIWVRVTSSFSRNSNSNLKGCNFGTVGNIQRMCRPAEDTSTWRLPALLPGVGVTSAVVCVFPKELLWRGWSWFFVQLLINSFIVLVTLLFTQTLYRQNSEYNTFY
jgi:hypothetical protein